MTRYAIAECLIVALALLIAVLLWMGVIGLPN